ncbi:MAG: hypothetical protein ACUVTM_06545 [Candidatus Bathyarchaeia archaeon]
MDTTEAAMKPLEIILGLSRVRLPQRIPIVETAELLELHHDNPKLQHALLRHAENVTKNSYWQFSSDEVFLTCIGEALLSNEYLVTASTRVRLSRLVNDVCGDKLIYNGFQQAMRPLFKVSESLEELSIATRLKAGSADRKARDVAGYVGVEVQPNI